MIVRLAALFGLAIVAMLGSLLAGGTALPMPAVLGALAHPHAAGDAATIVWQLRLPRVLIGALVGASLSIAGALLQGMLRNPIVDPFLTGVSAGAAVAIVIGITAG
ncbi:MAG TPA: iron chelate uptake ABC transporter family permease subunit, partial [Candidatus Baltobacteraceae bacterium]